jgi:hypothetical protein
MKFNINLTNAILIACIFALTGCQSYEKGFEYQTETSLKPLNSSGVRGSAVMGYGVGINNFRVRIVLYGLNRDAEYQIRFFDALECSDRDLMNASRIDGVRIDSNKRSEVWGFDSEPVSLTSSSVGTVKKDFFVSPRTAGSIYIEPDKYPTIVIYALGSHSDKDESRLAKVACGTITSIPHNQRPHT